MRTRTVALLGAALIGSLGAWPADDPIPYPDGYRQWSHVASSLIAPAGMSTGGIHNIYANPAAIEGYRTGRFPNGAVIVGDLLQPQTSPTMTTAGARVRIAVMLRDSARYAATGGWGFEQFRGDSRTERQVVDAEGAARCFSCHSSKPTGVFSELK